MAHICSDGKGKQILQFVYQRALNASELNLDLFVNDNLEQAIADLAHLSPSPFKWTREQRNFERTLKEFPKFEEFRKKIIYNSFPGIIKLETRTRELVSLGLFEDALNQYSIAPNKQCKKIPSDLFSYFVKHIINSKTNNDNMLLLTNRLVSRIEKIPLHVLPLLITHFQSHKWPNCKNKLLEEFKRNAAQMSPTDLCKVFVASSIFSHIQYEIPSIYIPYLKYVIYSHHLKDTNLKSNNKITSNDPFIDICLETMPNGPDLGTVKLPILRQVFLHNKSKGSFIHGLANTIVKSKIKPAEECFEQYIGQIKLVIEAGSPNNVIIGLIDIMSEYIKNNFNNQLIITASQILWSYSKCRNIILDALAELSSSEFIILLGNIVKCCYYIDQPDEQSTKAIVSRFNDIISHSELINEFDIDYLGEEIAKSLLLSKFNSTIGRWDVRWNCIIESIIDKLNNCETRNIISHITKIGHILHKNVTQQVSSDIVGKVICDNDLYNMYRKILKIDIYADKTLNDSDKFVKLTKNPVACWGKTSFFYKYPDSDYIPLAITCESIIQSIDNGKWNIEDISKIVGLEYAVVDYPRLLLLIGRRLIKINDIDLLGERLLEHLPSFDLYQACSIAWSLAALDYLPIELLTCLTSSINIKLDTMHLEPLSGSRLACFLAYTSRKNPFIFFNQISPFQKVLKAVGFGNKTTQHCYHYRDSILSLDNQQLLSKIAFEHSNFFDDPMHEFAPFYYDGISHKLKIVLSYYPEAQSWTQIGSNTSAQKYKQEQLRDQASPGGRLMQEKYAKNAGYR